MFRRDIVLRRPQDAAREVVRFRAALGAAGLPQVTAALLEEQVESALLQFQEQMQIPHVQKMVADRLLEGDGYRVSIEVRLGRDGVFAKLLRLLRGG
ncbi:hypothetical protein [Phaeospirillum tilakii]|uniref:Uncharacterized protein n=1 Tax=Phaeospirillum tilakii TaxID=741673 RepID=A0ABW5CFN9_9PROT